MGEKTLIRIKELLSAFDIPFEHLHHESIPRSSRGASEIRGTPLHKGAKALVLHASSGNLIQVVIPAHRRADLKALKRMLGEKNLSLASPDTVLETTGCIVGSVPPLGRFWELPVFVDKQLLDTDKVVFSAGTLEDSVRIEPQHLVSLNKAEVGEYSKE
ncbi:MAG: aminoacyl-tRNA deacylase [Candidatus Woesearchaeota archaeon]